MRCVYVSLFGGHLAVVISFTHEPFSPQTSEMLAGETQDRSALWRGGGWVEVGSWHQFF